MIDVNWFPELAECIENLVSYISIERGSSSNSVMLCIMAVPYAQHFLIVGNQMRYAGNISAEFTMTL